MPCSLRTLTSQFPFFPPTKRFKSDGAGAEGGEFVGSLLFLQSTSEDAYDSCPGMPEVETLSLRGKSHD